MIQVSQRCAEVLEGNARSFRSRLLVNGQETSGLIRSIKIYKGSCGDALFSPGAIFSTYATVVVDGMEDEELEGKTVAVQIGALIEDPAIHDLDDGTYALLGAEGVLGLNGKVLTGNWAEATSEWSTVATLTVESATTTTRRTTLSLVGKVSTHLGVAYATRLSFPASIEDVKSEIEQMCGVAIDFGDLDTSLLIEKAPKSGLICREVLMQLAGLFFGYVTEDSFGNIKVATYKMAPGQTAIGTDGDRTSKEPVFSKGDLTTITGIRVLAASGVDEGSDEEVEPKTFSYGVVNYFYTNPLMTEEIFAANVSKIVGLTYRSGTTYITLGDYRLEPGDWLAVEDLNGDIHPVPCMAITHSYDGGINTTIVSPPLTDESGATYYRGATGQLLKQLTLDVANILFLYAKQITADRIDLTDLFGQNIEVTGAIHSAGKTAIGDGNAGFYLDGETGDAELGAGNGDYILYQDGKLTLSLEQLTALIGEIGGHRMEISALENKLRTLISDDDFEKLDNSYGLEGSTGLLVGLGGVLIGGEKPILSTRSALSVVEQDVDGLSTRMESVETTVDEQSGEIKTINTKTAEIVESVEGIEQRLTSEYVTNEDLDGKAFVTSETFESTLKDTAEEYTRELTAVSDRVLDLSKTALALHHNTSWENGVMTMRAVVSRYGEDVTEEYPESWFEWINRHEAGDTVIAQGYSLTMAESALEAYDSIFIRLTLYKDILPAVGAGLLLVGASGALYGAAET